MADTPAWFVESDYLTSKLNQLKELNKDQYGEWDEDDVAAAIEAAGMTSFQHFEAFSGAEGTSPNAYFNAEEYLTLKAAQMNRDAEGGRSNWAPAEVASAISAAGMTPWAHFQNFGWKEGVSPSMSFNVEKYFEDKLAQLQEAGEDYENVDQVKAVFAEAGLDPVAHYYAFGEAEGLEPKAETFLDDLTVAVQGYQDAVQAREDFLEEAEENELVEAVLNANPAFTVEQAIAGTVTAAKLVLDTASPTTAYDYTTAADDVIAAMIVDDQKKLATSLKTAETAVAGQTGLKAAIDAAAVAFDRLSDSKNKATDADNAATGKAAEFNSISGGASATGVVAAAGARGVYVENDVVIDATVASVANTALVVVGANGKVKLTPAAEALDNAEGLLAAAQAHVDAQAQLLARAESAAKAYNLVIDADEGTTSAGTPIPETTIDGATLTALLTVVDGKLTAGELAFAAGSISQNYLEAKDNAEDFADAVADYNEANGLASDLKDQDDAVTAAKKAITDLDYNFVEFDASGLAVATDEVDVFAYVEADGEIALFGAVGADVLYIGDEFTFNEDIDNGDNAVLEVFFTQQGDDVLVQIETAEFGSNAQAQELDTIVLTGVSVEDLTFDQGYVQFIG